MPSRILQEPAPDIRCRINSLEIDPQSRQWFQCRLESLHYGHPRRSISLRRGVKGVRLAFSGLLVIEGWLRPVEEGAEVLLINHYGGHHFGRIVATSNLVQRRDLPPQSGYFVLSVLAAQLLHHNQLVLQLRNGDGNHNLVRFSIDCQPLDRHLGGAPPRYISLITAGRSGSTLLCKSLNAFPGLLSPSQEQHEPTMLRSSLNAMLDGLCLRWSSTVAGCSGDRDPFWNLPHLGRRNPFAHAYSTAHIEQLMAACQSSALSYYRQAGPDTDPPTWLTADAAEEAAGASPGAAAGPGRAVIVEKNWCNPFLPLLARRLGMVHLVLVRHPIGMANSIRAYQARTGFNLGFDPGDPQQLATHVARLCNGLAWLARHLPAAVVLRYEDLVADIPGSLGAVLEGWGMPPAAIAAGQAALAHSDLSPQLGHRTEGHGLSAEEEQLIVEMAATLIDAHYGGTPTP